MKISARTKVCGIIGDPVEHSLSPVMHNAAFAALDLDYVYLAFRVKRAELKEAIGGIRSLGVVGVNVTMPHKIGVLKLLDSLSPAAESMGAINTIHNKNGELVGYNTDGTGAMIALERKVDPRGKKAVLLGAGGAARAIAFCLAKKCKELTILNRTKEKAVELAKSLHGLGASVSALPLKGVTLRKELSDANILVNTTPVGMTPNVNETPVTRDLLKSKLVVFDVVYNPPKTKLLKEAEAVGAVTVSGVDMLVNQGAITFKIWTGHEAPVKVMRQAVLRRLKG